MIQSTHVTDGRSMNRRDCRSIIRAIAYIMLSLVKTAGGLSTHHQYVRTAKSTTVATAVPTAHDLLQLCDISDRPTTANDCCNFGRYERVTRHLANDGRMTRQRATRPVDGVTLNASCKKNKKAQLTQGLRTTAPSFQDSRQPPSWILSNRKWCHSIRRPRKP